MRDFTDMIGPVAQELWGPPNARLSNGRELRWGEQGGRMVRLDKDTWADHSGEHGSINAGGVLDLIARETGGDRKEAVKWLEQRGYDVGEAPSTKTNGHVRALGKEVAAYDYTDENGELLFQVVRFDPKEFRQRKRDETGGWSWRVAGVRQVPYRLPEVMEAAAMGHPIYVVEGEKDVENLRAVGIIATSNAGGAGKWRSELCEFFRGADVIVLQDNDPQAMSVDGKLRFNTDGTPVRAGKDHAHDVARQLHGIASKVRVADLSRIWSDMPAKADVSDWLRNGGTAEQLHAFVEQQPLWTPAPFRSRFGGMRWEDIGAATGTLGYNWFVEDVIPMGEISLVFGDSGTGKSFNMFDLAMASARGMQQWNSRNVEPGLVVYVAAEAGKGFSKRKIAYAMQHNLKPGTSLPFYLLTKRPNFFHDDEDVVALIAEIKAIKESYSIPLVCIVIDTLSALAPGMNENASQDVSMVRRRLVMMQDSFDSAIILVHHKPKGGSTPRGHSSLTADFETTIEFTTKNERAQSGLRLHQATVRKQREGLSAASWEFTLPVVEVGRNKWGNPETSCVVATHAMATKAAAGFHATPNEMQFMKALYDALNDHPVPPPAGLPPTITRVVEQRHIQNVMRSRYIDADGDTEKVNARFRQNFKRAGEKLRDGGVIGNQGLLIWPTGKVVNGFNSVIGE